MERERKARMENNDEELQKIFPEIVGSCGSDEEVLGMVRMLTVKRGQSRPAIKWMIGKLFHEKQGEAGFVGFFSGVLRDVIEGRIFLEEERIYITEELKRRYESSGDVESALEMVINVPVETFTMIKEGTMVNYQLEQLRLCVANRDWVRADITLKKIRKKYFENDDAVEEKTKFHEMVVHLYLGQRKYFDASSVYHKLSNFGTVRTEYVVLSSFFCILATCETEMENIACKRAEMLRMLSEDKNNDEEMRVMVRKFLSQLVLEKSVVHDVQRAVSPVLDVSAYLDDLASAVDEHNFRIIERFYSSATVEDMSAIMQTPVEDVVRRISFMVNNGFARCKINQKTGVVGFGERRWSDDVVDVMDKLIRCNHLIHKERLKTSLKEAD